MSLLDRDKILATCNRLIRARRGSLLDPEVRKRLVHYAEVYTGYPTKLGTDIQHALDVIEELEGR